MQTVNEIIMMPIDKVIPYDKNPRKNDKTVELLTQIIPKVGFNVPLVLDKENVIVKGHARYQAAIRMGMKEVPCVISDADPEEIRLDRIADNKVIEFSKWINEELAHEVDMFDIGMDMSMFGLNTMKMDDVPFEFDFDDNDDDLEMDDEERRKRFEELMAQQMPVEITTQGAIDSAKRQQISEAGAPPKYFSVTCEKCGHVMFVREGDAMEWE